MGMCRAKVGTCYRLYKKLYDDCLRRERQDPVTIQEGGQPYNPCGFVTYLGPGKDPDPRPNKKKSKKKEKKSPEQHCQDP